jgi:hypothetical protein
MALLLGGVVVLALLSGSCSISSDSGGSGDDDDDDISAECGTGTSTDLPSRIRMSADGRRLVTGLGSPKDLYDFDTIHSIQLVFAQSNWWTLLTNNYQSGTLVPAQLIYDGETLAADVGVRFKGFTSYTQNRTQKKSFHIDLDYEDAGQDINGMNDLILNCAFEDDSFMREIIYEHVNQLYIPAVDNNWVELTINGESWGLYVNSQCLDNNFIKAWFPSTDGTRWRAKSPSGGMGGFGNGTSALKYLGDSQADYTPYYTLKRTCVTDPWASLIDVCTVLASASTANVEDAISEVLDLDRTTWFLALENIFTDEDSYINKGADDYYLYWDITSGLLTPLEIDGNSTLLTGYVSWSPFRNATNANFPLLFRLLNVPAIRQRYLAHIRTILSESFNAANMTALIDACAAKIDAHISADPKKMMTYGEYISGVSALKSLIATRASNLNSNSEVNVAGLTVTDAGWTAGGSAFATPSDSQPVAVYAAVSGSMGVSAVYAHVGEGITGPFTRYRLLDDGQNEDGAADDGVFGVVLPGRSSGTRVRFYIEAVASNPSGTRTYYPAGAAHDVFTWLVQ